MDFSRFIHVLSRFVMFLRRFYDTFVDFIRFSMFTFVSWNKGFMRFDVSFSLQMYHFVDIEGMGITTQRLRFEALAKPPFLPILE